MFITLKEIKIQKLINLQPNRPKLFLIVKQCYIFSFQKTRNGQKKFLQKKNRIENIKIRVGNFTNNSS